MDKNVEWFLQKQIERTMEKLEKHNVRLPAVVWIAIARTGFVTILWS